MKKSKKIISIILAVILIISVATTVLIASANAKEAIITVSADKAQLSAGESATVSVKVNANFAVATMSIPVFYDKTLVTVSNATATLSDYAVENITTDATAIDDAKVYANTDISAENFGFVLVNYIGAAGATVAETMDSVVLTFTVTAKADVSGTAAIKCVSESAKTDENIQGMLYFGSPASGNTIDEIPENIENIALDNATTSVLITNGAPQLKAIDGTTGVVDETNKYVYGIDIGTLEENFKNYFTVENGAFTITKNASGYKNGTGATLNVVDLENEVVDTYTIIIFGDVDGNGAADSTDTGLIMSAFAYLSELTDIQMYAADVNGDGSADSTDEGLIMSAYAYLSDLSSNPYQ